jgi:hypothetical protein
LSASSVSFAGSVRKFINIAFVASSASFSTTISTGGQQFQKALDATAAFFSGLLIAIKTHPAPPIIIPVNVATPVGGGLGVSFSNPSIISVGSNGFGRFSKPGSGSFTVPQFGTADGWSLLGSRSMPGQLLIPPRNGYTNGFMYLAASGIIVVPSSAIGAAINFVLNQNYFRIENQTIKNDPDTLATLAIPFSLNQGTHVWSIMCRIRSGYNFRATAYSLIENTYTITIDGVDYNASGSSDREGQFDPRIQLSLGVQFQGSVNGSDVFQVRATQLELQQ